MISYKIQVDFYELCNIGMVSQNIMSVLDVEIVAWKLETSLCCSTNVAVRSALEITN